MKTDKTMAESSFKTRGEGASPSFSSTKRGRGARATLCAEANVDHGFVFHMRLSACICGCLLSFCGIARGEFPPSQPYPGITYAHETRTDPPQSVFVVTVDLSDSNVSVRVAPGG